MKNIITEGIDKIERVTSDLYVKAACGVVNAQNILERSAQDQTLTSRQIRRRTFAANSLAALTVGGVANSVFLTQAYAAPTMDFTDISSVLDTIGKAIQLVGGLILAWGAVKIGQAYQEQQGNAMDAGIGKVVGGAVILVAGLSIGTLSNLWSS
ncbi:MAG: hypothetical protein RR186_04820 [Raoultibacter sp.]